MFDREPNIDIVFLNGLKDLEVLPPGDVWENIPPMPGTRRRYGSVISIAAGLAVLMTLTLLASWFTRNSEATDTRTQLASLINESDAAVAPKLLESSTVMQPSPQKIFTAGTSDSQVRAGETTITNITGLSLPSLAIQQNEPVTDKNRNVTPVVAHDSRIVFPQRVFGIFNRSNQLAAPERPKLEGQRFMLGASLSPSMGFNTSGEDARLAELLSSEKGIPSYSTGLTFAYKLSPRFSIQSGLGIASVGQLVTGIDIFAGLSEYYAVKGDYEYRVETTSGTIISGNADLYLADSKNRVGTFIPGGMADPSKYPLTYIGDGIHQLFRYLEVPLLIRYKVIDRDIDLNLSGGMFYGLLVDNIAYTMDGSSMIPVGHTEGVNVHTLSSQVGIGMEYNISKMISFNVEPVFRYYLTPFSDLSGTLSRPYSFGLFSGFFLRF